MKSVTEEELIDLITREVRDMLGRELLPDGAHPDGRVRPSSYPLIPLGISNRHIHLTAATFRTLFGDDTAFEEQRPLYQPGEFASKHALTVVGPKLRSISTVRILGPLRQYDQVEVSLTDAIFLGIEPPVANSGSLEKAAPLTLVGPNGSVYLEHCAIVANRHIHMPASDARRLGVLNGNRCRVRIPGDKSTVFENVLIRVNDSWKLQIHLDTDDANAANVREGTDVEFLGVMDA